jgi:GntR family transcriptional repressor for pyruvate dehydrogenase complex
LLKPVEKQRVAEEIVQQLRKLILEGHYAPGQKLPPERQLAAELGVNRATIREGLKKLEHLGLVRIRQGDGTRVQDFMRTGGIDLMNHLVPLSLSGQPELLKDVLEFRRIYGREVARLAAQRADKVDLKHLEDLANAADETLPAAELLRLDFEFYVGLTQATKNRVLALLINTVRSAVLAFAPFFAAASLSTDVMRRHHRALLKAIGKRDEAQAAKIADTYLKSGADALLGKSDS